MLLDADLKRRVLLEDEVHEGADEVLGEDVVVERQMRGRELDDGEQELEVALEPLPVLGHVGVELGEQEVQEPVNLLGLASLFDAVDDERGEELGGGGPDVLVGVEEHVQHGLIVLDVLQEYLVAGAALLELRHQVPDLV